MSKTTQSAFQVMQSHFFGVLSTQSQAHEGYPFGSVVPYCLDETGTPLILISALAQHTKNIQAHNKVSLTLLENGPANIQQAERLTLLAMPKPLVIMPLRQPHSVITAISPMPRATMINWIFGFIV